MKDYVAIPSQQQYQRQQQAMSDEKYRQLDHEVTLLDKMHEWYRASGANEPLLPPRKQQVTRRPSLKTILGGLFLAGTALFLSRSFIFHNLISPNDSFSSSSWLPLGGPQTPEEFIKAYPSSESLRSSFRHYASMPHLAGTDNDKALAEWTRDQLINLGINDTTIDTYYPYINFPTVRRLAIENDPDFAFEAKLKEDVLSEDPDSSDTRLKTFHAMSADGNVTAPVVYVNYGRLHDFQFLAARGVNFTGTIALMRQGKTSSGAKVRIAETYGCVGALLYTDPMEDGPYNKANDDAYPHGPWRSASSVKRDTVAFDAILPGDPLTPGYAATENVTRLLPNETYSLPTIPSLPLSWSDALPLFRAMEGLGVKADVDWLGGMSEVNYYSGPSVAVVNLVNHNEYKVKPIWNVLAQIRGSTEPSRAVILGTHRDAFAYGGASSASGSAVLLELARILGMLMDQGWKPRRTLVLASWDGQEFGNIGSTEWVEDHKSWLEAEAVAYINVDHAVTGPHFSAQASPMLHELLYAVTSDLIDPRTSLSLFDAWKMHRDTSNLSGNMIDPLGGGADHVAFFEHVGVTSLSMQFVGPYGVDNSIYDSVHWMEKFGDPTFEYHQLMTRVWGLLALRLVDDVLLPFSPSIYANELQQRVAALADEQGCATLPELSAAVQSLYDTAMKLDHKLHKLEKKLHKNHMVLMNKKHKKHKKLLKKVAKANERLAQFEKSFIDPMGLPGREWFKHIVYAPGLWTGAQPVVFPSITEALESGANPNFTREMEERTAQVLEGARSLLKGKHAKLVDDSHEDKDEDLDDDEDEDDM